MIIEYNGVLVIRSIDSFSNNIRIPRNILQSEYLDFVPNMSLKLMALL